MSMGRSRGGDKFDSEALTPLAGIRALWRLYKRGMWGPLEDFGLRREDVEPSLMQFDMDHVVKHRLTKEQARKLARLIPELEGASVELRLGYALKFYDEANKQAAIETIKKEEKKMMRHFHAEVAPTSMRDSEQRAFEIAEQYAGGIVALGGTLTVGRNFNRVATIMISLPDDVNPTDALPSRLHFHEAAVTTTPAVPDNGVPSDDPEEGVPSEDDGELELPTLLEAGQHTDGD